MKNRAQQEETFVSIMSTNFSLSSEKDDKLVRESLSSLNLHNSSEVYEMSEN